MCVCVHFTHTNVHASHSRQTHDTHVCNTHFALLLQTHRHQKNVRMSNNNTLVKSDEKHVHNARARQSDKTWFAFCFPFYYDYMLVQLLFSFIYCFVDCVSANTFEWFFALLSAKKLLEKNRATDRNIQFILCIAVIQRWSSWSVCYFNWCLVILQANLVYSFDWRAVFRYVLKQCVLWKFHTSISNFKSTATDGTSTRLVFRFKNGLYLCYATREKRASLLEKVRNTVYETYSIT